MSAVLLGISFAILASISNNIGIVLQKKVVNAVPFESREVGFFKAISRQRLWLLGLFLQLGLPTGFLLYAQYLIGPTLVPGLQGIGLIFLVIGSIRLNNETLQFSEYVGILFLVLATALIGFSGLQIEVSAFDFQQTWFFIHAVVFTVVVLSGSLILELGQKHAGGFSKGVCLTMLTGFLYVLSDFWTSPLVGTIESVFKLEANWAQWALFLMACVLLVTSNVVAIGKTQVAFKYGPASILIPIRHVPVLLSPVFVFYFVYNRTAPGGYSLWFFLTGILLVFAGSILLGRREAGFVEEAQTVESKIG